MTGESSKRENGGGAAARMGVAARPPTTQRGEREGRLSKSAAAIYERLRKSAEAGCLGLLRRLGASEAEAEEVFSETYVRVMERVDPVKLDLAEPQLVNLLKVACRRQLIELRRREGVIKEVAIPEVESLVANPDAGPEVLAERSEAIEVGREALLSLPQRDRLVFQLRYEQDLTPAEVQSRVPGLTPNRYRKAIQRANAKVLDAYLRIQSGERCEELDRATLTRFISGAASADLAERVEAHLRHCRACRRSGIEMREQLRDVASILALAVTSAPSAGSALSHALASMRGASSALGRAAHSLWGQSRVVLRIRGAGSGGGLGQALGVSGAKVGFVCAGVVGATCAAAGVIPGIGAIDLSANHKPTKAVVREAGETPSELDATSPNQPQARRAERDAKARRRHRRQRNHLRKAHEVSEAEPSSESPTTAPEIEPEPQATEVSAAPPPSPEPAPAPSIETGESEASPPTSRAGGAAGEFGP